MTTNSNNNNNHHGNSPFAIACVSSNHSERLAAYIVDLLNDEQAIEIEQHLNQCELCKERYLLMLRVRSEAPMRREVSLPQNGPGLNDSFDGLEATNQ